MPKGYSLLLPVCYFLTRILPVRAASEVLARFFRSHGDKFLKMHCIRKNLRDAFPDLTPDEVEKTATEIAENFGRHIAEIIHAPDFRTGVKGAMLEYDQAQRAKSCQHSPAIYVGAHLGSWELGPLAFERLGQQLTVVYSQDKNSATETAMRALRRKIGGRYLAKSDGAKPIIDTLSQGKSVAFLVDQRVDSGLEVDFFGRRSVMTRFPARMAIKFACPIIPFEVIRTAPGYLRVVLLDPIMPFDHQGEKSEMELTQRMAHSIQASIERNRNTWFCHTRRWKDREIKTTSAERGSRLASLVRPADDPAVRAAEASEGPRSATSKPHACEAPGNN